MDIENRLKECTTNFDDFLLELPRGPRNSKLLFGNLVGRLTKQIITLRYLHKSMRNVIAAQGGFAKFAEHTNTNSEQLYNMLNGKQLLPLNNLLTIISDLQDYCMTQD